MWRTERGRKALVARADTTGLTVIASSVGSQVETHPAGTIKDAFFRLAMGSIENRPDEMKAVIDTPAPMTAAELEALRQSYGAVARVFAANTSLSGSHLRAILCDGLDADLTIATKPVEGVGEVATLHGEGLKVLDRAVLVREGKGGHRIVLHGEAEVATEALRVEKSDPARSVAFLAALGEMLKNGPPRCPAPRTSISSRRSA